MKLNVKHISLYHNSKNMKKETLDKFDICKMYKIYDKWPELAEENYNKNDIIIGIEKPEHIVFVGMGGSGTISDVFAAMLSQSSIHVDIVKGYHLPRTVNQDSLLIVTSVSGNTNETLNVLKDAINDKCKIIAFSDGGKIQEICERNNILHVNIKMCQSPRASLVSFLYGMLKSLKKILEINESDVQESLKLLKITRDEISSNNLTNKNDSLELSNWITEIPIIYYPWGLKAAAIRFKNSLQENAKIQALTEDIIESSHNGIVPWMNEQSMRAIFVQGKDDFSKTKERWEIIEEFFTSNKIDFKKIQSVNGSILSKLVNLIYILDYATIYLAVKSGIDPVPVEPIDFIKDKLRR